MSRQGQPTRNTCNMPFRNRRLSWGGRALRPRSEGSSTLMMDHSASDTSLDPTLPPKGSLESEIKPFGNPLCQYNLGSVSAPYSSIIMSDGNRQLEFLSARSVSSFTVAWRRLLPKRPALSGEKTLWFVLNS
jgi:hypothetical protein